MPFFINSAAPKVHLRFDEQGNADENKSDFNYKPRIIFALIKNLELHEEINKKCVNIEMETSQETEPELIQEEICLKPRIIKAIGSF